MALKIFSVAAAAALAGLPASAFPIAAGQSRVRRGLSSAVRRGVRAPSAARLGDNAVCDDDGIGGHGGMTAISTDDGATPTRRAFVGSMLAAAGSGSALAFDPLGASAADTASSSDPAPGAVSPSEVARRLRSVPTFTIVDKRGVPYMVFGEDAKLTAYFFTEYGEAKRLLGIATSSSDKARAEAKAEFRQQRKAEGKPPPTVEEEAEEIGGAINPWKEARISTVPLDFAVTLSTRSPRGVYFRVAPSEDDVADALALDKEKDELSEGKVPLFYFEDFKVPASEAPGYTARGAEGQDALSEVSPVYFRRAEAIAAWRRVNPKGAAKDVPEIKVSELTSVITEMVKPGGGGDDDDDIDDLRSLVFVPPVESSSKEKVCKKAGGKEKPFIIGERIVVL